MFLCTNVSNVYVGEWGQNVGFFWLNLIGTSMLGEILHSAHILPINNPRYTEIGQNFLAKVV